MLSLFPMAAIWVVGSCLTNYPGVSREESSSGSAKRVRENLMTSMKSGEGRDRVNPRRV
jgi:hypothetical protein